MTLYELIRKYSSGKGEDSMWKAVSAISNSVDENYSTEQKQHLMRSIYHIMSDGHYNEVFAKEDIEKMYYIDESGDTHYGPYWTDDALRSAYDTIKNKIPGYNVWDFSVVMSMLKSDMCVLLHKWFPNATPEDITTRIVELSVNWLNDDDDPYGGEKIWKYFNG